MTTNLTASAHDPSVLVILQGLVGSLAARPALFTHILSDQDKAFYRKEKVSTPLLESKKALRLFGVPSSSNLLCEAMAGDTLCPCVPEGQTGR